MARQLHHACSILFSYPKWWHQLQPPCALLLFFMLIFSIFYLATAVERIRSRLCALPTCFTRCSSPPLFHMADLLYVRLIQPSQYPSRSVLAAYSYHCFHIQLLSHTIYFILFDTNPGPHSPYHHQHQRSLTVRVFVFSFHSLPHQFRPAVPMLTQLVRRAKPHRHYEQYTRTKLSCFELPSAVAQSPQLYTAAAHRWCWHWLSCSVVRANCPIRTNSYR